ncbi:MAG: hypothetical protein H6720_02150 [Sandaracinus sp.]|nr:hypothetical protein [Sandaracinus sp.]
MADSSVGSLVLTPDDFVLHRAFGGDVVRELEDVWSPELRAKLEAFFLAEGFAPDAEAADPLVARLGAPTVSRLRELVSPDAFAMIHEAVGASRARDLDASVKATVGVAAVFVASMLLLGVLWLRVGGNLLFSFLVCGGSTFPALFLAVRAVQRRRRLRGRDVRAF